VTPSATTTGSAGTVTFTYTAGTGAGTCIIAVTEAEAGVSTSITISQTGIPPTVVVGANPSAVPIGTSTALTVTIANPGTGDAGADVTFSVLPAASGGAATCGGMPTAALVSGTSPYTATSSYTASSSIGFCVITATTAGTHTAGSVTVDQTA
jgi:hypothetical protein